MSGIEIAQRSDAWFAAKCGKFSASSAAELMAKGRSGAPSATRANLIARLIRERLTGKYVEGYKNAAMERGVEMEAEARDAYSFARGVAVEQIGLVDHPRIPNCCCSPDGLIGEDGLLEIKCPSAEAQHLNAILKGAHAIEYNRQIQFQLMVANRRWCDIVSYNPHWPAHLQLAIVRVERDDKICAEMVGEIARAEAEIAAIMNELQQKAEAA